MDGINPIEDLQFPRFFRIWASLVDAVINDVCQGYPKFGFRLLRLARQLAEGGFSKVDERAGGVVWWLEQVELPQSSATYRPGMSFNTLKTALKTSFMTA